MPTDAHTGLPPVSSGKPQWRARITGQLPKYASLVSLTVLAREALCSAAGFKLQEICPLSRTAANFFPQAPCHVLPELTLQDPGAGGEGGTRSTGDPKCSGKRPWDRQLLKETTEHAWAEGPGSLLEEAASQSSFEATKRSSWDGAMTQQVRPLPAMPASHWGEGRSDACPGLHFWFAPCRWSGKSSGGCPKWVGLCHPHVRPS